MAEGDGLGNKLTGPDARFMGSFRDLPDCAASAFARREQSDRRAVELRGANQLEAQLEGGEPEAERSPTFHRSADCGGLKYSSRAGSAGPAGIGGCGVQPVVVGAVVMSPPTALVGGNRLCRSAGTSHRRTRHSEGGRGRRRSPVPSAPLHATRHSSPVPGADPNKSRIYNRT